MVNVGVRVRQASYRSTWIQLIPASIHTSRAKQKQPSQLQTTKAISVLQKE
uniref:Uncharacterized protein n=1 Tax=Octopus bimaculoides TaxID=37653 RepID=A0A0L8IG14_OCTBM